MENIYYAVIMIVIFVCFLVAAISLFDFDIPLKHKLIGLVATSLIFCSIYGAHQLKNFEMTKEVSLKSVPVQGTKNFIATVHIEYVDGHFERVALVPGTTVEEK